MSHKLKNVLLLDDNIATNYIHKKFLKESNHVENIIDFQNGEKLLAYLQSDNMEVPELIFIDINMPSMDAWEFLAEFEKIKTKALEKITILLLSTSLSPTDNAKAEKIPLIKDIYLKPLSVESINQIMEKYFFTEAT